MEAKGRQIDSALTLALSPSLHAAEHLLWDAPLSKFIAFTAKDLYLPLRATRGFPGGSVDKEHACNAGDTGDSVQYLGWKDPLEEDMATCSSILAWRIPWTEESAKSN